ncbi:MAG: 23S rRNA (guanosine(2251)-2'-O)-methyltransferase RlmB [Candidatus Eremiobacteraeota bacterium]|nr:23S rRNA (guanosine(2251)-2'-O)-methyltransferase RlmB [Candidatus Eremiobacteraeota bacterium]
MSKRIRSAAFDFDDLVYGIHAVDETLRAGEALREIHVNAARRGDPALRGMLAVANERKVPVTLQPRAFFDRLPFKAHQGVVAVTPPFPYVALQELLTQEARGHRTFVVLDHLTDPHNVGAIARTAEATGATGIILPERRAAGINATVRKSAAGATAYLPIARVGSLAGALRSLKEAGIWVVGADASEAAIELDKADLNRELAIVIGAEGQGLGPLIKRECDYLVRIPMRGRVASLNASVAAAVLLYETLRQRECSFRP